MSQVLITESKLDNLADALGDKISLTLPATIDEMTEAVIDYKPWTSGIYQDEDGYICVSPELNAGGIWTENETLFFPESKDFSNNTFSITENLININSSNENTKVLANGSLNIDLTPFNTSGNGKITSVTVTMGGIDITNEVFHTNNDGNAHISQDENGYLILDEEENDDKNEPWIKKDNRTYLHISIESKLFLTVNLAFGQTIANGNSIDWGDNTEATVPTHTGRALVTHTYTKQGNYIITITNTNGYFYFGQSDTTSGYIFQDGINNSSEVKYRNYTSILRKVELGKGWKINEGRQFNECHSLTDVYISVKPDQNKMMDNIFSNCYSLSSFDGIEGYLDGITDYGWYVFSNSTALTKVPIPKNMPKIGNNYNLGNKTLTHITIPNGVTEIQYGAFSGCENLIEVEIPESVITIATNAFANAYGIHELRLKPTTPPTLQSTSAFSFTNANAYPVVIKVPAGTLSDYQTATNWSTFASYMQEVSTW